jgi:ribonuclease-3
MSRPRLHDSLQLLYQNKDQTSLENCLNHEDFEIFANAYHLRVPKLELVQAFTHTSFSHEFQIPHQEQLEFLGDSVLQLILTEELCRRFPQEKEGRLSKMRSSIVNEKILSEMAHKLDLGSLLLIGKGEFAKKLQEQNAVLADTFEALLAQIYRHHGFEFTKTLMLSWLEAFVPNAFHENFMDDFDAKSKLQEAVLARYKKLPRYTSEAKGTDFEITLWINDEITAQGVFSSKKNGEKELAKDVLKKGII